jgi:hypothetical protein
VNVGQFDLHLPMQSIIITRIILLSLTGLCNLSMTEGFLQVIWFSPEIKKTKRCSIFLFFYNGCWAVSFRSFQLHRDYSVCKQFRNFIENKN